MQELLLQTWILGLVLSLSIAPIGCMVLWRRVAFFADSMAHASFLGLALGLLLALPKDSTVLAVALAFAAGIVGLTWFTKLSNDLVLAILAPVALSLGYIVVDIQGRSSLDPSTVLFGDMLAATWYDIGKLAVVGLLLIGTIIRYWRSMVLMNIDEEWAKVQGIKVQLIEMLMMAMVAVLVAVAAPIIGVLLITAMMVIPAASALAVAKSPETMVGYAFVITLAAMVVGSGWSFMQDLPTGATIICIAFVFMVLLYFGRWVFRLRIR